ncbi:hypothetical protein [Mycoplasma parvum]|uniref:Uncharacterized protein n=1 Tax=Mycoplasma parvum str. Indiana TaxID=1403316 RepID=U5NFF5_9MOLU|nr:hypothetical protein [Mycoplasma parvum]AGX88953.1 hypothetical protein PRV_00940 [Mycoplasma parvum str. Indiana]
MVITEESKNGSEKKVSLENGLNFTVTRYKEDRDYKNRIKIGVNCMNGDLIGWGNDFLDKQPKTNFGWDKFQHTFEKGLKGYLNLIFGCDYRKAVEAADSDGWWNIEEFGRERENVAMVGIVARNGKVNGKRILKVSEGNYTRGTISVGNANFEEIWKIFEGRRPRGADRRVSITNTAVEVWMYRRNDFESSYIPRIQKLVRESIARSLIRIVFGAQWCIEKGWDGARKRQNCKRNDKYQVSEEFKEIGLQNTQSEIFNDLKLDGREGFTWQPGNGVNGKPKWMWDNIKKWDLKNNERQWWSKVKEYLQDISKSSWFYNQNIKIAKILCYEIFKGLIGQEKLQLIKSKEKWCKVGWNGATCLNSGIIWKK